MTNDSSASFMLGPFASSLYICNLFLSVPCSSLSFTLLVDAWIGIRGEGTLSLGLNDSLSGTCSVLVVVSELIFQRLDVWSFLINSCLFLSKILHGYTLQNWRITHSHLAILSQWELRSRLNNGWGLLIMFEKDLIHACEKRSRIGRKIVGNLP